MQIFYDWPQSTAMTLVIQDQDHSAYNNSDSAYKSDYRLIILFGNIFIC